ncbi:AraC family transcriptional regulator [Paenibacillus abyssi]|uniref:HTH araC/xylS-type domain-containing protein n=1 Tax=Paenibacillus abyssi TaxID=1340531 RepID=A0A917CPJ1_9BACL|nr:AraC family transcriptional regulator [Paenibacillus abyssi]GGF95179.1 hypothetical protein GCM10010916_10700 [Paenibacillus abyssi]
MYSEALHEQVHYQNPALRLKVWPILNPAATDSDTLDKPWHYHEQVEFLYIFEGSMLVQLEQQLIKLEKHDVMIVDSNQLHRTAMQGSGPLSYLVLQVDLQAYYDSASMMYYSSFSHPFRKLSSLNNMLQEDPEARQAMGRCLLDIHEETSANRRGYELAVSHNIKQLMLYMIRYDRDGLIQPHDNREMLRWKPVLDYIDEHLSEKLDIKDLSRMAFMSYHYFSKSFTQTMGMPVTTYINWRRIKKAEQLLLTQDISIHEIAETVGLINLSHFYKMFNKFNNMSPKRYKEVMLGGLSTME